LNNFTSGDIAAIVLERSLSSLGDNFCDKNVNYVNKHIQAFDNFSSCQGSFFALIGAKTIVVTLFQFASLKAMRNFLQHCQSIIKSNCEFSKGKYYLILFKLLLPAWT
jgi:hypothetical protein